MVFYTSAKDMVTKLSPRGLAAIRKRENLHAVKVSVYEVEIYQLYNGCIIIFGREARKFSQDST